MKKAQLKTVLVASMAALALASPAAEAGPIWDRIRALTTGMASVKDFLIYAAFLLGMAAVIKGLMDMWKKSNDRGDQVEWSGIGLKLLAGAMLISFTVTSDTMKETFLGDGSGSTSVNQY